MSSLQPPNDAKYVNSMTIALYYHVAPLKREKKCILVEYLIYAVLSRFEICHKLRIFPAKYVLPKFQSSQKNVFSKSGWRVCYQQGLPRLVLYFKVL